MFLVHYLPSYRATVVQGSKDADVQDVRREVAKQHIKAGQVPVQFYVREKKNQNQSVKNGKKSQNAFFWKRNFRIFIEKYKKSGQRVKWTKPNEWMFYFITKSFYLIQSSFRRNRCPLKVYGNLHVRKKRYSGFANKFHW